MTLDLTNNERLNFQLILPLKGSLQTLNMVESILDIVKIQEIGDVESDIIEKFEFSKEEIIFLKNVISVLDKSQGLHFQALSLIKKIMNIKEL